MAIYDKPVRFLMKDMIKDLSIKEGDTFSREQAVTWFKDHYPKVKLGTITAHLTRLSINAPSRTHYSAKPVEDDVFYQIDGSHFRLYEPKTDQAPIRESTNGPDETETLPNEEQEIQREFAYEKDLQNFLAKNIETIEPGLKLYEDEEITGIEFPVGGRFIDILALDSKNNFVVIELKVSRGYDRVIGQILRYMAWIQKNQAESNQKVRGIIVARTITEDLLLACSSLPNVDLYEYKLSINLKYIPKET